MADLYRDQSEYPKLGLTQWSTWLDSLSGGASSTDVDFCLHNARRADFLEIEFKPMRDGCDVPGTVGQRRALWAKAALPMFTVWIVEDERNREAVIGQRDMSEKVRLTKCKAGGGSTESMISIEELNQMVVEWWEATPDKHFEN